MSAGQRNIPQSGQTRLHSSAPSTTTTTIRPQAVLHLRGAPREDEQVGREESEGRRIQWAEDVVDNEGMGKKKSKVCCIYHAPKGIDESSDESSSDSDSDSDSGDDGAARPSRRRRGHDHDHDHGHDKGKVKKKRSPNAYEKVPKPKSGGQKEVG